MPSKKENEAILTRLRALFNVIQEEAQKSPEFLERLGAILLSDQATVALGKSSGKPSREPIIHIVETIHAFGEQGLRDELQRLTNDQLARLAASESRKRLKEANSAEREELIHLLVETAANRLKQGESFMKKS